MKEAIANLQSALDDVKPHLGVLVDLETQAAQAKQDLATIEAQIKSP